jgi:uncharacterized protein (TIGR02594 family)
MNRPPWLEIARKDIGLREIPGAPTAPKIAGWLQSLGAWWRDDETPWCGVAVAAWMQGAGVAYPKAYYRAKAWLDWGHVIAEPAVGCVVVFEREGGGHVGIVTGYDQRGRLMVLGGNQGNAVSEIPFEPKRVAGYRWPADKMALLMTHVMPTVASAAASSRNEA